MDAATLKVAKNYTNEQAAQKATNSPVEEIAFDGGIYSVGNNVVNGQVSVTLKGNTRTNLAPFEEANYDQGRVRTDGLLVTESFWIRTKNYVTIQPNAQYIISVTNLYRAVISEYKSDGTFIQNSTSGSSIPFTTTDNTTKIKISIGSIDSSNILPSNISLAKPLLETGGTIQSFITGTKSTNSVRLRSVNEDETKESIVNVNLPEPLRSLPNGVKDEVNVTAGAKTQRVGNKTNVASGTVINYADMATGGQFVAYYADGTQQIGVEGDTLTALATTLTYQLATPIVTKLPAQAPLQVFENGTVYVDPIGDASESTLPTTELAIPIGTSNKFGVASHDYDRAAADWTLTNSESKCFLLAVSNAGGAANIIAPNRPGTMYAISNASGYAITVKKSGGTGVAVTNAKTVLVIHNGTDYTALTAEL